MKKCPKCNENFEDEKIYCSSCGESLIAIEKECVCEECGQKINGTEKFCPNCGEILHYETCVDHNVKLAGNDEKREYRFSKERFSGAVVVTNIIVDQCILDIKQHKEMFFMKYGKQGIRLDIRDITDVISKKKLSGLAITFIILGLIWAIGHWSGFLFLLFGLFTLKTKYLYIYFRNGYIAIPEELNYENDMSKLLEYIRIRNPDCIRIYMDN